MKKEILFVIPDLSAGGAQKSLVSLLNEIDYEKYEIDLLQLYENDFFKDFIPKNVKFVYLSNKEKALFMPFNMAFFYLIRQLELVQLFRRILISFQGKLSPRKSRVRQSQRSWTYIRGGIGRYPKKYDFAIGYLQRSSTYFVVDKVQADIKIGWMHIDYIKSGHDPEIDRPYFEKLDNIVACSDACMNVLVSVFPNYRNKILSIDNIVNPRLINLLSESGTGFQDNFSGYRILTIGRLDYQKGYDFAIEACKRLYDDKLNIRWYVIGAGPELTNLRNMVIENKLEDSFIFMGQKSNPYPYIKQCDVYVQPSRWEGKSIAIDEAKVLYKQIITTNYPTVSSQIEHQVNGIIVEMSSLGVYLGIKSLMRNANLGYEISENLKKENLSNSREIEKLYCIFEEGSK